MQTYYITTHAITRGILSEEADEGSWPGYIRPHGYVSSLKIGRDCFLSKEEAVKDCMARVEAEIASSRKRIEKLEHKLKKFVGMLNS